MGPHGIPCRRVCPVSQKSLQRTPAPVQSLSHTRARPPCPLAVVLPGSSADRPSSPLGSPVPSTRSLQTASPELGPDPPPNLLLVTTLAGWAGRPQEDHSGQRSRPPSTWGRGWQRRECPVPKGAPSGTFHIQARRSQPGTRPARAWTVTLSEAQPLLWCRDSAVEATRVTSTAHREDVASVKQARCHRPRQQRSCSATAGSQTLRPWSRRCSGTQAGSTRSHWVTSFLLGRVHSTTESLLLFQGTDPTSASTPASPWPQLAHWQIPGTNSIL